MRSLPSRPYIPHKARQQVVIPRKNLPATDKISIIIPTLNESRVIIKTLMNIQPLRQHGHEVILVDGGSNDDTVSLAEHLVDQVITTSSGRAHQMNTGARHAWGNTFLFLHADSLLPDKADELITLALKQRCWGFFKVRLDSRHPLIKTVAVMMNLRSRISAIATGDQAIFIRRNCFEAVAGFAKIPLMEDIQLCKHLKQVGYGPSVIAEQVISSARRWQQKGIVRTILLMWQLRWAYWRGTPAEELVKRYYPSHE